MKARILVIVVLAIVVFGVGAWSSPAISLGEDQEKELLHFLGAKGGAHVVASFDDKDGSSVVTLREHMANDDVLALLPGLPGLKWLTINPPHPSCVTDSGAAHLEQLTNLEGLNLYATDVSSPGLRHLLPLSKLKVLTLGSCIDDSGMSYVADLKGLEYLDLNSTQVSDAGLPDIGKLSSLQTLNLSNTRVTSRGMGQLQSLTNLELLNLSDCSAVDAGVLVELTGEVDANLMSMLKTSRLKMLFLPERIQLEARDIENLVRMMGMSRLQKLAPGAIPADLKPDLSIWRNEIDGWQKLGAYVEFDAQIDLAQDSPKEKIVGLYFLGASPQKRPDDFTLGFLPPNLERLSLRDQPISDAGLQILVDGQYTALERINLYGCASITIQGVEKLDSLDSLPKLNTIFVDERLAASPYLLREEPPLRVVPLEPSP